MITGKSFHTSVGSGISSAEFLIREGLQQGTVNSPVLFNIFLSDLPRLFGFNESDGAGFLAYADDVVIYVSGNRVDPIQNSLDLAVDRVNRYYMSWNLRLNPQKCKTILFKKPVNSLTSKTKAGSTQFQISATIPGTANKILIPHKKVVKYLGVHIDYLLRGNKHLDIQLQKANRAFVTNSRLFYNKYLSKKAKLILYMLLVRPIITYAAPVIWNYNHTSMERARALERKCLRACLRLYRTPESDWQLYVKNQTLYNTANITRIDSFWINLTRDYFSKLPDINNTIIQSLAFQDTPSTLKQLTTGYLTPQAFPLCDRLGLIQDANNIPIIFHWRRNKADKRIAFNYEDFNSNKDKFKYSTAISIVDRNDFHRLNFKKYWWLSADGIHMAELATRRAFLLERR